MVLKTTFLPVVTGNMELSQSTMTATTGQQEISGGRSGVERGLAQAWRKERRFTWVRGGCHLLLWIAALLAIDVALDWFFVLPGGGRIAILAVNALALLWVIYRWWWRELRRFDVVRVALQIERHYPELQSILVSYVQFHGGFVKGTMASPGLIRAMERQAVERTQPLDFREIVNFRRLRKISLVCLVAAALFAVALWQGPTFCEVFYARMLDPGSNLAYPTRTKIRNVTGDLVVQQGKRVTVTATAGGVIPDSATLHVRSADGVWEKVDVPGANGPDVKPDEFVWHFGETFRDFSYMFRVGDAKSKEFSVTVVPPPRITNSVTLRYPEYTRLMEKQSDALSFDVPEGTEVEWRITSDVPLEQGMLVRKDGDTVVTVPMTMTSADGKAGTLKMTPRESFFYYFSWTDKTNDFTYDDKIRYFIRVVPDIAPKIKLVEPARDEKGTVQKTVKIVFDAEDDYGLGEVRVVYSVNDGPEQRNVVGGFDNERRQSATIEWSIRQSISDVKEGDTIRYAIEVSDNRDGGAKPNHGISRWRRINVVSESEYLAFMLDRKRRILLKIKHLHEQEKKAVEALKELKQIEEETEEPAKESD